MTQQINNQIFAFTKQFTDSAFKAQALALKGLETVAELQLKALEQQSKVSAEFVAEALETRDVNGLRSLWEKGTSLSRDNAERSVAVSQEILAITQKTANTSATKPTTPGVVLANRRNQPTDVRVSSVLTELTQLTP